MTTQRDPDRLLQVFLDEGPEVLPDRVLDAVETDIHRMRQRAAFGPWRFNPMRTFMAAAAVAAVLVVGGGLLWATRPPSVLEGPTPQPTPTPQEARGALAAGTTYLSTRFSQPFQFTMPLEFGSDAAAADLSADQHTLRIRPSSEGAITFHDDIALPNDLCHPTGTLPDVPDDVEAWLSTRGVTVSAPDFVGDSTLHASFWDIELGPNCISSADEAPGSPTIAFSAGERHRIYRVLVPVRDPSRPGAINADPMLIVTWGAGYGGVGDEVLDRLNSLTDSLVTSIELLPTQE